MSAPDSALLDRLAAARRPALGVGVIALGGCLAGAFFAPDQFFRSYLFAWVFWTGLTLGCL